MCHSTDHAFSSTSPGCSTSTIHLLHFATPASHTQFELCLNLVLVAHIAARLMSPAQQRSQPLTGQVNG